MKGRNAQRASPTASLSEQQVHGLLDQQHRDQDIPVQDLRRAIDERRKFLRLLRCDQMQGFLFSRPVPREDIEQMLKSGANTTAQAHVAADSHSSRTVSEPEFRERREAAQEAWGQK